MPAQPSNASAAGRALEGDTIIVCGRRFPIDARVVAWDEPGGYDAYATAPGTGATPPSGKRYLPGRRVRVAGAAEPVERAEIPFEELRANVDKLVLHYDVCGTSERCFHVLHELRGLSVHFLLDVDGTLYQTLDLREQAWHARQANPTSIGVEIAQIGAYPPGKAAILDDWYAEDALGTRLVLPERWSQRIATPRFVGRPARSSRVRGQIQDAELVQYDFTPQQYDALAALVVALAGVFPELRVEVPRDERGAVRQTVLADDELERFAGVLGHYHVSSDKLDPGPAFDWEGLLRRVRRAVAAHSADVP